ncbi:hypothetical protein [Clostridium perfringens]|uniref:hypothetical protein n=1 Tax=Clostridium perfringens TaxID=1502 RepID=UPI001ABAAFC8|nr:hypothetical protein [Clostridium perfringens]MBO3398576.1 hypothetical protein [Clostridium perfringens]
MLHYSLVKDVNTNIRTIDEILNMEATKYVFKIGRIKVLFNDVEEVILKTNKRISNRSYNPLGLLSYLSELSRELRDQISYVMKNVVMSEERKNKYKNGFKKLFIYEKQFEYLQDNIWNSLSKEEKNKIAENCVIIK